MSVRGVLLLAAALLSLSAVAEPQTRTATASDAERAREIDRIARRLAAADSFSGVVLVASGDSILYRGAFGSANKQRGIPIQPDTRFALASLTKTFVTVAVAKLAEEGKLSWDDSLGKFLPDFPLAEGRDKVRIKHLLTHTSGLRELQAVPERAESMDDYLRMVAQVQKDSLLYRPGTRAAYNNANFVLLGKIIELATSQKFYDYIGQQVFRPAAMQQTGFDVPGRAEASVGYPAPYAGAYSTARDLFRFARALRSGRILRPQTAALLFSPKPEAGNWGYGFDILDEKRGLVGHGGSWVGISNSLDMFTRSGYTAVILSNYTRGRSPLRESIWALLP